MGYVTERGKGNWYAIISTKDQAGKRKVKFISLPDAKNKREANVPHYYRDAERRLCRARQDYGGAIP